MSLHKGGHRGPLRVNPLFGEADPASGIKAVLPRHRLPDGPMPPATTARLIRDELMLDGNARLNLATFVTTWMEPEAAALMADTADKNIIDKDEYPLTAELEQRCVAMLAGLWNAPDPDAAMGCSTTGSSEACMLAGMALKRRWTQRRRTPPERGRTSSWARTSRCAGRSSATSGRWRRASSPWRASGST